MINNNVINIIREEKPYGFEVNNNGGTIRYIEHLALKRDSIDFPTRQDIIDTINSMIISGEIIISGYYDNNILYKYVGD